MAESAADHASPSNGGRHSVSRLRSTERMLAKMSARRRRVFLLRIVEGCSYADIAERLDLSLDAVEDELAGAFEVCATWEDDGEDGTDRPRRRD